MIEELIAQRRTFDHVSGFYFNSDDEKILHVYDYKQAEIKPEQVEPGMFVYIQLMDTYDGETKMIEFIVKSVSSDMIEGQVLCEYPVYDVYKHVDGKGFVKIGSCVDDPEDCIAENPNQPEDDEVSDGDLVMLTYTENQMHPDDENWDDPTGLYMVLIHPEDIDIFDPELNVKSADEVDDDYDDDESDGLNELSFVSATKYMTFISGYEEYANKYRNLLNEAIQKYNADEADQLK